MEHECQYDEERLGTILSDIRTYIRDLADLPIRTIDDVQANAPFMQRP
jgi:hypothetical protein